MEPESWRSTLLGGLPKSYTLSASRWQTNNLLRRLVVGFGADAVLLFAVGMAKNSGAMLAPAQLILFLLVVGLYLTPIFVAMHRDCESITWIALVDVLLGWTILGWFDAFGWSVSGKTRALPSLTLLRRSIRCRTIRERMWSN